MLKLVKLPNLVAKCCKVRKIYACEVCKFFTSLHYAYHKMAEIHRTFGHFVVSVIQKYDIIGSWDGTMQSVSEDSLETMELFVAFNTIIVCSSSSLITKYSSINLVVE